MIPNIVVRKEMPADDPAVRRVNEQAFGRPFVIVLGHPDYCPRFGFVAASCSVSGAGTAAFPMRPS